MSPATTTVIQQLAGIVGGEHVFADPARLAGYAIDGTVPAVAVTPASAAEVAEVVRLAAAEKLAIVPVGARTKLGIGLPPSRHDVALDMTRMNRVVAYDPGDLTLGVEAGMPLAELARVLEPHRQWLPLAVPFTTLTTVGGTIASGIDSPLRQFYGTARDYVLGVEFVTGEGKPVKSGGRVVKNVAGYDLHKLMIGSLGTLGVITSVNFRTFPQPPASRGFVASFANCAGAFDLRQRIARSHLTPLTLEVLTPGLAQVFAARTPKFLGDEVGAPGPWFSTREWTLCAGFGGNEQLLARYERDLNRLGAEAGATSTAVLDDTTRPIIWGRLRECIALLLESSPLATIFKISALPSQLGRLLGALEQTVERQGLPFVALARGVGTTYLALLPSGTGSVAIERLADVCAQVFDGALSLGEHATIPWCPAALKRRVSVWGPPRNDTELMRRVKQVFDPRGTLSPGRFYGDI